MSTRASTLSLSHIEALNLIDLEFAPSKFKRVRSAWKAYRNHLNEKEPEGSDLRAVFYSKRSDLFVDMLYEMAVSLGYDFDKTQIAKDAYATVYHEQLERDANTLRKKLVELLNGEIALPMAVTQFPSDPEVIDAQADYLKLMAEHLRSGKPWPITIVGAEAGKIIPMRPTDPKAAEPPGATG